MIVFFFLKDDKIESNMRGNFVTSNIHHHHTARNLVVSRIGTFFEVKIYFFCEKSF